MITDDSIQKVREIDLVEVIKRYVNLKKNGANWKAPCPFHDENTASFVVSPVKGIYNCFGCGKSGNNPISFIMEHQRLDFISAVKFLADYENITLEEIKTGHAEEPPEVKAKKVDYLKINKQAAKLYQEELAKLLKDLPPVGPFLPVAHELLRNRQLTIDTIIEFQIGYAPANGRLLSKEFKEYGLIGPAEELGLVKQGQNGTYDIYRDRIMFPIHNERGEVVGFGGRKMEDGKKDNPKYINSRDSLVYKKENVLYGLYQAGRFIRNGLTDAAGKPIPYTKLAHTVEGYYDVTGFHQAGLRNTVAACGTAFTDGHAKLLKKHTNHIILMGDGDGAGERANLKNVDMLLRHNFKVEICPLPEGQDPDSFARAAEVTPEVQEEEIVDVEFEPVDEEAAPF